MTNSPYNYTFDPTGDSTAARVVRNIGNEKYVLELGCAYGVMTKVLVEHNKCRVFGVEFDEKSAQYARAYCEDLAVLDIENANWEQVFGDKRFDVIVAADVLEHLRDPQKCLVSLRKFLTPDGCVVLSIPNVAHNGIIAELLSEDFRYRETGLLDATHLRFWGAQGIKRLLTQSGFATSNIEMTRVEAEQSEFADVWSSMPGWIKTALRYRDEGNIYQYIVKAFPAESIALEQLTQWPIKTNLPSLSEITGSFSNPEREFDADEAACIGQIAKLNQKIEKMSTWGATLQVAIAERDTYIINLNQKAEEVSIWGKSMRATVTSLNQKISDKQAELMTMSDWVQGKDAELMKMSDWAQSMALELNRRNTSFMYRAGTIPRRCIAFARRKLAQSFVGDVVHYMRGRRHYREKRVSLEAIRQSVLDNDGKLIITFPIITWDFRWQRPQHIISRLRDKGFSVLYVAMTLSPLGRRLRSNNEALSQLSFNELAPHVNQIWLNSYKKLDIYADSIDGDELFNISKGLDALISELRPKSIIYLVQFPGWGPVAQHLREKLDGKIIFDCMDDHAGFSTNTAQALKTEEVLIENSDLVITSSNLLEERVKVINANVIQVKNGTEFEHFTRPVQNGRLDHLRNFPIIGYYGAISDWFDMRLVAHCASQRQDWHFVLIGSTFGADLQPVAGLANVHFLGEQPYKDLPGYLAYFDVCTIPFKVIPLTLATNPVKFYEYLSAGKPVVSVDLPELHAYQEDCYLARNADDFLVQLERAYLERNDEKKIERRLKLASENSWDARVGAILESEIFKTWLH